jgi:carotenoid 9,10(9',10')-cleavage dioxygenase 1
VLILIVNIATNMAKEQKTFKLFANGGDQRQPTTTYDLKSKSEKGVIFFFSNNFTWLLTRILYALDGSKWAKKSPYLQGNFAPIPNEVHSPGLKLLSGSIPPSLAGGSFARVGPNPLYEPLGRHHWFDGDGMIHAVYFKKDSDSNGGGPSATYNNHFVQTSHLAQEKRAGYPVYPNIGDFAGISGLFHIMLGKLKEKLGVIDRSNGGGTANTALAAHAGRLLALNEGDTPYCLAIACSGLVETLGRVTWGGELTHSFTAHPKIDAETGECFFFGYTVETKPYVQYCWLDKKGNKAGPSIPINLPHPIMMHDMAITQHYALFLDMPLVFTPEAMIKEKCLPFVFDKTIKSRVGVLPRYATDEADIKWFELPRAYMCFHTANAWEEEEEEEVVGGGTIIKLYCCLFTEFSLTDFTAKPGTDPHLHELSLNMSTGQCSVRRLISIAGDFPVVQQSKVGRKAKYAYVAAMESDDRGVPDFYGVAKIDLEAENENDALVGLVRHGSGRFGGEAYYAGGEGEDDGFLMTFIWDENIQKSEMVGYSAKTMSSEPVFRLEMPHRVPHGFHTLYVGEEDLKEIRKRGKGAIV